MRRTLRCPSSRSRSGQPQLFVDDTLIATQSGLLRTLRQPKKDHGGNEPVLAIADEFGESKSTLEANGTILYDPKLKKWVMFTLAFCSSWPGESADRVRLYRFTSADALTWIKGDDGTPQRIAIDLPDSASGTSATNIDLFSCTYDENDSRTPYKGWLFFANWGKGREGTYYMSSPDGIHWNARAASARGRLADDRAGRSHDERYRRRHHVLSRSAAGQVSGMPAICRRHGRREHQSPPLRGFLFTDRLDRPINLEEVTRLDLDPRGG